MQLVKFNQNFGRLAGCASGGHETKIYLRTTSTWPGFRIDWCDIKALAQNRHRTIHIPTAKLHLLNTFAKSGNKARDGPAARWIFAREHIQRNAVGEVEFKFLSVLVWRNVRQGRLRVGLMNSRECFALHSHTHGHDRCGTQ